MNFAAITWVDTFPLAGSLRQRDGLFKSDPERPGLRLLPVRGLRKGTEEGDEDFVGYSHATKWVELTNLIGRIRRIGEQTLGAVEFGRIGLLMIDAGASLPWHAETSGYFLNWQRAYLPVRTNPATALFSGVEVVSPGAGFLTVVNVRAPCSAVNLGETPWVMLVVDFRRKDAGDA